MLDQRSICTVVAISKSITFHNGARPKLDGELEQLLQEDVRLDGAPCCALDKFLFLFPIVFGLLHCNESVSTFSLGWLEVDYQP